MSKIRKESGWPILAGVGGVAAFVLLVYAAGFCFTAGPISYGSNVGCFRAFASDWEATIYRPVVKIEARIRGYEIHAYGEHLDPDRD